VSSPDGSDELASPPAEAIPAPEEGEYLAPWTGRVATIGGTVLVIAGAVYCLFRILTYDFADQREWLPGQVLPYVRLGACLFVVFFACVLLFVGISSVRRLTWDATGLEFTPIRGKSQRFTWEDVVSFDPVTDATERMNAILRLSARLDVFIYPSGEGYASLVRAMAAHHKVWEAARRPPAETEREWDGITAPAAGAYWSPWWLLPSRLAVVLLATGLSYYFLQHVLVPDGGRPSWLPDQYQPYAWYLVAIGTAFVAAEGARQCLTHTARVLQWEPDGFWLGWYTAPPRFHRWEELASVSQPSGTALGKTVLALTNGQQAALHPSGRNYAALVEVLEQHGGRR
jgi:hypothetical protein